MLTIVILYAVLPMLLSPRHFNTTAAAWNDSSNDSLTLLESQDAAVNHCTGSACLTSDINDETVVHTKFGVVKSGQEHGVRVFHGIPFAQPPVGELRWQPPKPISDWAKDGYDASWVRPGCPQRCHPSYCPINGTSEDCLFLEIYVPFLNGSTSNLPVLIFLHGGGFKDMSATTSVFYGAVLAKKANMVVVVPEYRIGSLGFLVTGNESAHAKGNLGILDQKLAIEWVAENIQAFGGDPKKVTLGGHSAGALSVITHLINPETAKHFRFVTIASAPLGVPFRSWSSAQARGEQLAKDLECSTNKGIPTTMNEGNSGNQGQEASHMMACLRGKSVEEILKAEQGLASASFLNGGGLDKFTPWGPVIDGVVVKVSPLKALLDYTDAFSSTIGVSSLYNVKFTPMIIGIASEEAHLFVQHFDKYKAYSTFFHTLLTMMTGASKSELSKLYPTSDSEHFVSNLAVVTTDAMFLCPLRTALHRLAAKPKAPLNATIKGSNKVTGATDRRVWTYTWKHPMNGGGRMPKDINFCRGHTCHGAELPYLFQSFHGLGIDPTAADIELSDRYISLMANFVATGDPNRSAGDIAGARDGKSVSSKPSIRKKRLAHRQRANIRSTIDMSSHNIKARNIDNINYTKYQQRNLVSHNNPTLSRHDILMKRSIHHGRTFRENAKSKKLVWPPISKKGDNHNENEPSAIPQLIVLPNKEMVISQLNSERTQQCKLWEKTEYKFKSLFGSA